MDWDEEEQLRDHFRCFNVSALQKIATGAIAAESCIRIEKLAEGAYNKVFKLTMNA